MAQQKWRLLRVCFLALFCTKIICIVQGQSSSSHDAWFDVRVPLPPNATSVLGFCSPCLDVNPTCTPTSVQHFYPPITGNMFSINLRINQSESLDYCYLLDDNTYEYLDVTYLECCNGEQEKCNFPSTVPTLKNCEWIPLAYIRPQFVPAEYKTITVDTRPYSGINGNSGAVFLHATFDSDIEVAEINGVPVVGQVATTTTPSSANNKISIRLRSKVGKFVRGVISYTFKINCTQNATFSYGGSEISLFENTGNITLYTENYYTLPLSFESFQNSNWNLMFLTYPRDPTDTNIYFYPWVDQGVYTTNIFVTIPKPYNQWNNPTITPIQFNPADIYPILILYNQKLQLLYYWNDEDPDDPLEKGWVRWTLHYKNNITTKPFYYGYNKNVLWAVQFVNETTFITAILHGTPLQTTVITLELWDIDNLSGPINKKNFTTGATQVFLGPTIVAGLVPFTCGTTVYFLAAFEYFNILVNSNFEKPKNFSSPYGGAACYGDDDVIYVGANYEVFSVNTPNSTIATLTPPTGFSVLHYYQATKDFLCAIWWGNGGVAGYNQTIIAVHTLFTNSSFEKGSIVKQYKPNMYSIDDQVSEETIVVKDNTFYVTLEASSPTWYLDIPLIFIIKMPESKENGSALSFTAYTGNAANLSTPTLTLISSDDSDIQITITYNDGNLTLTQPDGTVGQNQALSESKRFDIVRASDGTFTLNSFETGNFSLSISAPPTITASSPPPPLNTTSIAPRSIVDWNQAQENEIACLPTNEYNQKCTFEYKFAELDATKGWNISLTLQRRLCSARYSMHLVNIVPENFVIQSNVWSYTMQVGECIDIIAGSARILTETLTPSHPPGISGNWTLGNFSSLCTSNKNSTLQTIYTCSNESSLRETIIKSDCALYWNFSGLQSVNNDIHDSTKCIWYGIGDFTGISLTAGDVAVDPTTTEIYYRLTGPFLGVGTQLAKVPAKYKNIHKTSDTFPWTVGKEDGFIVSGANISSIQVNSTTYKNCPSSNPKTTLFLYSDLGDVAPPSKIYLSLNPTNDLKTLMVRPWFQWEGVEASGLPVNCADKV